MLTLLHLVIYRVSIGWIWYGCIRYLVWTKIRYFFPTPGYFSFCEPREEMSQHMYIETWERMVPGVSQNVEMEAALESQSNSWFFKFEFLSHDWNECLGKNIMFTLLEERKICWGCLDMTWRWILLWESFMHSVWGCVPMTAAFFWIVTGKKI